MTSTPKTIKYTTDIGTFNMLPGNPFRASFVRDFIIDMGLSTISGIGAAFIITEGYTYDFTPDGDSDLATYFNERGRSLPERFELFGWVDADRIDIIFGAYTATRDNLAQEPSPENDDEKEAKKNRLKASSEQPSEVSIATEG